MAGGPMPPPHAGDVPRKARRGMQVLLEGAQAQTGQSPKEIIWSKNKARLYRYVGTAEQRFATPIVLVYALINRPYVLDLLPGNSFVEYLVRQGFDVFLLDWGAPGDEDSQLAFDEYILDYLAVAVRKALRAARASDFTLFGYCMGGTMAAMYAALFPEKPLRNLVLLTSPIDFTPASSGLLGLMTSEQHLDADRIVATFGNVPPELIDLSTKMLRPVANYVGSYVTMWDRINHDQPMDTWLAINKWVNDGIPFAGAAFRQWIHDFYQRNALVRAELQVRGRQVDPANITCPLLAIAGRKDHICTLSQAEAIMRVVASPDKELLVLDAGHVGLLTGSEAKTQLWPKVRGWLAPRSK
ncbi:MAG TPA: class III poly(R)-hydroxyalkanoic acid synthase subunit PhaC [Ktedonobacterales bacterium]